MFTKNESRARAKDELQIAVIDEKRFAIEEKGGNMSFNLTQMAKLFGPTKRPGNWLKTEPAQEYLAAIPVATKIATVDNQGVTNYSTVRRKRLTADLIEVRQGGIPERQGTWTNDYRVAIEFARWLSPKFSIAVNELVFKILTKQVAIAKAESKHGVAPVIWDGRPLYPYTDVVRALGGSTRGRNHQPPQELSAALCKTFRSQLHYGAICRFACRILPLSQRTTADKL